MSTLMSPLATPGASRWPNRLLTLLLATLAAASAWFWVLHWPATTAGPGWHSASINPPVADPAQVARLLGASAAPDGAANLPDPVAPANIKLLGVIAPPDAGARDGAGGLGRALIAVEGGPPKPFRVGQAVTGQLMLQSVQARSAVLAPDAQSPATVTLTLPVLAGMATSN